MAGVEALVEIVKKACSQDPSTVKDAEEQIKLWEIDPNYHKALLSICNSEKMDGNIRWMSLIFFKNGIDKYWRRTVNRIFTDDDKTKIREILISSFSEPLPQVFLQKAIVIGRIARTDLKMWPDLIPCLLQGAQSEDKTIQYNTLLTLNHVIKNLVSKRLVADRRIFKQVSSGLLTFLLDLWTVNNEQFVQQLSTNQVQGVENCLRMSLLTLKVIRKMVIEGNDETIEAHTRMLLETMVNKIPLLLGLRFQYMNVPNISEKLEKLIVTGMKILLDAQGRHPILFVNVLEDSLKMAVNYVFSCTKQDILFERFMVQCANLIKGIVKSNAYKAAKNIETDSKTGAVILKAEEIKKTILTHDVIGQICEQIIAKYFLLKPEDLNEWENDPESYVSEEIGESSDYLIRPSTENLFLCLYYEHRQIFTDVLSRLVQSLNSNRNTNDPGCLMLREAVYFALGLASYELFGDFNFDQYFMETLLKELQNTCNGMKIIHRRVLWLIGRWVNVSFSNESRDVLYRILVKFTEQKEDLVVKITAAQTLKDAVDDHLFERKCIGMYLKALWENLFCLLIQVHECDTKMRILNVISVLIERTGREMQPYAASLCDYLPHLWADSADHNMLRCVMVTTLTRVVEALGAESMHLHPLLLPIIQLSTDIKQPPHVYLLEDGLELWLALIQNSNMLTENCLNMFTIMPILLEQTSDNFKTCIAIIESYIILDAFNVMKMHSKPLVDVVDCLLGQMKDEGNILLAELLKLILVSIPQEGVVIFEGTLVKLFRNIIEDQEYPRVIVSYLSLFGYIILHNFAAFYSLVQKYSMEINGQPHELAANFIDVWLDKVDCMPDDKSRKLSAMVLVSLLPSNASFINERFALILDTVVNVLYDDAQRKPDLRSSDNEDNINHEDANLETERKRKIVSADVVNTVQLLGFVRSKLEETRHSLGESSFHLLMETLDPVVAKQLMSLLV